MATLMAIIIPTLQEGERIEEWEPLFKAAVASVAERSIAAVALEKNILDEAFKLL